jgi:ABC-2 type transport system ATP-binding protein
MISIENLKVSYRDNHVLNDLNLNIPSASIHGLVGLNGSGKTTLLNAIFGLKEKQAGSVTYHSAPISKEKIAYLESTNYFYPLISGKEYLKMFQTQNANFDIEKWNELFELPLNKLVEDYSTGMKKKLAFIGVICLNREILILDEPFNGIDIETVQRLKAVLIQLKEKGKTIIITSHILESLLSICDLLSYLNNGVIQFTKEKNDFDTVEKEIFSVHQERLNAQIQNLLGKKDLIL